MFYDSDDIPHPYSQLRREPLDAFMNTGTGKSTLKEIQIGIEYCSAIWNKNCAFQNFVTEFS